MDYLFSDMKIEKKTFFFLHLICVLDDVNSEEKEFISRFIYETKLCQTLKFNYEKCVTKILLNGKILTKMRLEKSLNFLFN